MKLSVMAIENYLNSQTPSDSLFTNWTIPAGIDQDVLKREILVQSAEFEALYPDADFLKEEITNFVIDITPDYATVTIVKPLKKRKYQIESFDIEKATGTLELQVYDESGKKD